MINLDLSYKMHDMQQWLQDCIHLVASEALKRHVAIKLVDVQKMELSGDRNQLQQVMVNLLMNAIQVSDPQEVIEVSAEVAGVQRVQIVVSDAGKGIDESNKPKVFDPFFTTKSVGEGSGLGLSISLGIVQSHNGSLELKNNDKGGVDATITLPLGKIDNETK